MDNVFKWTTLMILLVAVSKVDGLCFNSDYLSIRPCNLNCFVDFQDLDYGINRYCSEDRDYSLNLKVTDLNFFDEGSNDPLIELIDHADHIVAMSVFETDMTSVPRAIYNLRKAVTVDLSKNKIKSLDLGKFSNLTSLKTLDVSFNEIADLEESEISTSGGFNKLNTIDISHNAIKAIPDNYFRQFPELLHLDLSHNHINNINTLTLHGITQLQSLYISDNEIATIDSNFAKFVDLRELFIDHNYLTSVERNNFETMTKLEKLNISFNSIAIIDNNTFDNLIQIKLLDLSNNKINIIPKTMFQHNNNLKTLDMSTNNISKIEAGTFTGKNIEDFVIHNNPISGSIVKNTFQGIFVEKLDLSGSHVTELGADLFDRHCKILNFSRNSISKIHYTTFSKLIALTNLDLSYNQLQSIDFDLSKTKISYLYINNNHIKTITNALFQSLPSLKVINLSDNSVEEIDFLSSKDLNGLESLILYNNLLLNVIPSNFFSGLASITNLDHTNSKISTIQNNALNGMESLKIFNASYSNVHVLEKNVFNGTGSIEIIDWSYNEIEIFSLNNANMKLVKRIYLQCNKIRQVTDETFMGLTRLSKVYLRGNDILRIENNALHGLKRLSVVSLSANKNIVFDSSIFSNLQSLSVVLLNNITSGFNFQNIKNTSITSLYLSFCDIIDVNLVYLYQIDTLKNVTLSFNKIASIDKISFQKLRYLNRIDLSFNKLSNIQTGSFGDNENLSHLNLSHNYLSSLQHGVFDGLMNLKSLDLSANMFHSFSVSVFHNAPRVETVYLDNNLIEDLNFSEFSEARVTHVSIGGNLLPCDKLTRWKSLKNKLKPIISVRANPEVFDKDNVDGISCIGKTDDLIIKNDNHTALTALLTGALEDIKVTIERSLNRSDSKIDLQSNDIKNVSSLIERLLKDFNESETRNDLYLEKIITRNNNTNRVLGNMLDHIKASNSVVIDPNTSKTDESTVNYNVIAKTEFDMSAEEKASLKNEVKAMFDDWEQQIVKKNRFEAQSLDATIYFIGTCLVLLLSVLVMAIIYVYFKFRTNMPKANHLSQSRQPFFSNSIETE